MSIRCNWCENTATRKDYRSQDGQTGKVPSCDGCVHISDVGVREIQAKCEKEFEEIFNYGLESQIDMVFENAMGDFWDSVNSQVFELSGEYGNEFESECGMYPHENTIEKWTDNFYNEIAKRKNKESQSEW